MPSPRGPLFALALAQAALGCGPDPEKTARSWAERDAGTENPAEAPPVVREGTIAVVQSKADVPLVGLRVEAKFGDHLLQNETTAVVVSDRGAIVDFGPKGGVDALVALEPTVFGSLGGERTDVVSVGPVGEGDHVLRIVKRVVGKPIELVVFVYLEGELLKVESLLASRGDEPALAETLGESVGFGNVPTWAEGQGFVGLGGTYPTDFVARESLGVSYALGSDEGHTLARFGSPDTGFHESANTGDRTLTVPARGLTARRTISVAYSKDSLGDAAQKLPFVRAKATEHFELPKDLPEGTATEFAACEKPESETTPNSPSSKPYARFSWKKDRTVIAIPKGCHGVRFTRDGYAPGAWTKIEELDPDKLASLYPTAGRLHYKITTKGGAPSPGRVLVRGIRGTRDPSWGDDPDDGAAMNTVYSLGEGERPLPPGRYNVMVHRGFEYTAFEEEIEVDKDERIEIEAELERVVDTKGWISADLHVHAAPSPDAPSPLLDRVRSLAASGVEVAVATDHNRITDYGPSVRELGAEKWLATIVGDEITTRDPYWGHFNVFPVRPDAAPVEWKKTTPSAMFSAARGIAPAGQENIVQVNHPRMGDIGYFELLRLDNTDVARWKSRTSLADLDFDALEVFNGDHYANIPKVEACLKDWYALLKAGFRDTATGNSDSHKITFHEAGVPRNFVRVPDDDPAKLDPKAFVQAIKRGRVVVSSGPFIELTANGKEIGDDIDEGEAEVTVKVQAPPWVDVDKVELLVSGEVVQTWTGPFGREPKRFSATIQKPVKRGDFITAIARGSKNMTFLYRWGAKPFAFTNPIWVR